MLLKICYSKRRTIGNICTLLNEDGHLTNGDTEKPEMFNVFFTSVFNTDDGPGFPGGLSWRTMTVGINSQLLTCAGSAASAICI